MLVKRKRELFILLGQTPVLNSSNIDVGPGFMTLTESAWSQVLEPASRGRESTEDERCSRTGALFVPRPGTFICRTIQTRGAPPSGTDSGSEWGFKGVIGG